MKRLIILLFAFSTICSSQNGAYSDFNTSRYTRVISLGNAFTGLADDIETVYYNSAGLAFLNYYGAIYSKGQGFFFIIDEYRAENFAILIPTFNIGKFAVSGDRLSAYDISQNLLRLHFATNFSNHFAIGTSVNYYYSRSKRNEPISQSETFAQAVDISLSLLFIKSEVNISGSSNEARLGIQLQNVFDTDIQHEDYLLSNFRVNPFLKHQSLRTGISFIINPQIQPILNLNPAKVKIVFDLVFYGKNYKSNLLQTNFGIELTILEFVNIRYGRENEKELNNIYSYSPQHPAKRFGIGLKLPIHELLDRKDIIELSFDYGFSDWDKIDETKRFKVEDFVFDKPVKDSFSIKIAFLF